MPADALHSQGVRIACFQAATVAILLFGSAMVASTAHAATSTIGRTWPIAEPDALAEIEAKVATSAPNLTAKFGPRTRWSALKAASLGSVITSRTRTVIPFYTLGMDVTLPDGRVLYPKGYTFNPLAFVSLPGRLVVVHAAELGWALRIAGPADWILLAASAEPDHGGAQPDPIALGQKVGRPLFLLEPRIKERLELTVAPVIVRQLGKKLELAEFRMPRDIRGAGHSRTIPASGNPNQRAFQ